MSYARTLQRKLDLDLIERLETTGRQIAIGARLKSRKLAPRSYRSYRGWKRNELRREQAAFLAAKRLRQAKQKAKSE